MFNGVTVKRKLKTDFKFRVYANFTKVKCKFLTDAHQGKTNTLDNIQKANHLSSV